MCSHVLADNQKIIMGYWSYPKSLQDESYVDKYPIPGSYDEHANLVHNKDLISKTSYLTTLAYAYLDVNKNGSIHFRNSVIDLGIKDNDFCKQNIAICTDDSRRYTPKLGNFDAFSKLNNDHKNLQKILSVYGSDDTFSHAINHIPSFVKSAKIIINHYHLNGIDLDFEPDSFSEIQATSYGHLVKALRKALGNKTLIFITVAPDQNIKSNAWSTLSNNANFISDMCYDFHAPFYPPNYTGYNSNLYSDSHEPMIKGFYHISCDQSIKNLTFLGVPKEKVILGYPSYGLSYGSVINKNNGLFQPFNPNQTPTLDSHLKPKGRVSYNTIVKLLHSGFKEHNTYSNGQLSAVWAYNSKTKQLITYDNNYLVASKVHYVMRNDLAGLITWQVNDDTSVTNRKSLLVSAYNTVARK